MLIVNNLSKNYGSQMLFENISLNVNPGEKIGLLGPNGAGKSTLLNRLAGEAVARTGVERPTSFEATLYVHESVALADLPAHLPVEAVRVRRHRSTAHRDVLWIDAPDIDSTAEANRRAALAWLPHVDLVCYVVSPERYRDDAGWRVLRQRGHKHGWIFVLNRWDEGDPRQGEDFTGMLREAGFESPLLLRTCCLSRGTLPSPDEFDQLQAALTRLLEAHGVQELTRLGHSARLQELRTALQASEKRFGDERTWRADIRKPRQHSRAGRLRQLRADQIGQHHR
jgi:energy-coupling factor transporter ATP-binding protein EcfA2